MTPDTALDTIEQPDYQQRSTAGMTTKVVKGSLWTLVGQVAPMMVSLVSTPFVIRFLGSESYSVLLLVGLIPTYFSFADLGMSVASTKFAAEAYGQGDETKEAQFIWTATAIAAVSALIIGMPLFLFSYAIVKELNVPEALLAHASIALKIASGSFFVGILSSVLNSAMLARLRMDLNTVTSAVPRILLAFGTPFILYFGGGIVEAVGWAFIVGVGALAAVFYFSGRLLPELFRPALNRELFPPLMKFGSGLVLSGIAAILLVNFEKLVLSKMTSVRSLAYYSVAYTLASMATLFSISMTQSLVPAFSQLLLPGKKENLNSMFASTLRLTMVLLLPIVVCLIVVARPFFYFWAGEEFGRESVLPFYILLIGVAFNLLAVIQHSLITSTGRTALLAKIYWAELVLYAAISVILVYFFGIVGAAAAWTIRVVGDAVLFIILGERLVGLSTSFLDQLPGLILPMLVLAPIAVLAISIDTDFLPIALLPIGLAGYSALVWKRYLSDIEKSWLTDRLRFPI